MTRLLTAIDDTRAAGPIVAVADRLAARLGMVVDLVHVVEDGHVAADEAAVGHRLRLLEGSPTQALAAELEEDDVAMAVIGARDLPSGPMPAGHITTALLVGTEKPVVVVPPDGGRPDGSLDRALVPLDGTEATARSVEPMLRLLDDAGIEVVVLHVFDRDTAPVFWDQPQHCATSWMEEFLARFSPRAGGMHLRAGTPGDKVLDLATAEDAGLLVLAWSQTLTPGRAATVQDALRRANIPVLLVPVSDRNTGAEAPDRSGRAPGSDLPLPR